MFRFPSPRARLPALPIHPQPRHPDGAFGAGLDGGVIEDEDEGAGLPGVEAAIGLLVDGPEALEGQEDVPVRI